jgi:MFS family permease
MTANVVPAPQQADPESASAPVRGARLALTLLLTINLFNYIDRQVLAAVLPAIENDFFPEARGAATEEEKPQHVLTLLGALQMAFMVSYMVAAPIFGWLADRMSRWLLIGVGVILWSVASAGSGLAGDVPVPGFERVWQIGAFAVPGAYVLLFLTRCFVGVGEGAYGPAAPTMIADLYPPQVRSTMLGWFYMAIPVGSALGYVLGGLVAKLTGSWHWAFYLVLFPGLMLGACTFFMPEPPRGQTDKLQTGKGHARLKDYAVFLRTPSYVLNTLGMTAFTFAVGGIATFMPRYIYKDRGVGDLGQVNLMFGGVVVLSGLFGTVLGGLAGDWLQRRFRGGYFLISAASMALAFPLVLLVLWVPFPAAWGLIFLAVFCLYFNTGPTNTVLANVTHPALRATGFAVNIFVIHALGDAISPTIIGFIADHLSLRLGSFVIAGLQLGFVAVTGAIVVGGLFWLWGARYLARDTALAPTRLGGTSPA